MHDHVNGDYWNENQDNYRVQKMLVTRDERKPNVYIESISKGRNKKIEVYISSFYGILKEESSVDIHYHYI